MKRIIKLKTDNLEKIRAVDERLVSYNIEMTEITGGTFWKSYTPGQIAGTEKFPMISNLKDITVMADLMQYYPPVNLYDKRLRKLAGELGSAWVRVSGTWATKTYYDFEGNTDGHAPEGYQSILTKEQWIGVLDFVKAVDGKLLVSVSNCAGDHPEGEPLDLAQAKKIFDFSHNYGRDIDAVEFMNEPNMLEMSGAPTGYMPSDYARDQDILYRWIKEHYPDCLLVGPCSTGDPSLVSDNTKGIGAGIGSLTKTCTTEELLNGTEIKLDVFSYHYYNGASERIASIMPDAHWSAKLAHTDDYLSVAPDTARSYSALRDRYVPGGQLWVTESGDAGGGGDTWASTYLDVFRTLNELGSYAQITDGVIFHNTLASSDYGFLQHGTFEPRPNYYAVLLWNRLMGTVVYDCGNPDMENAHIYCHSRRDGKQGFAYLVINNSLEDSLIVEIPKETDCYSLSSDGMRSSVMKLNGVELTISNTTELPNMQPQKLEAGEIALTPGSCTFFVVS